MIDPPLIGIICFLALLTLLLFVGMPVGFVMALVGFIGYWAIDGWGGATTMVGMIPFQKVTQYTWTVVPMFIMMGNLAFKAGFGRDAYYSALRWVGHLPGGLAQATVLGNAAFGAATGSPVAATVTFAKIAVPEMKRYGYDTALATGSVAAAGTLASMIPPSIAMLFYAVVAEQSVGKMFIAGILPGLLMALSYIVMIYVRCRLNPSLAGGAVQRASWGERILGLKGVGGIAFIFLCIMAGLYTGVVTPTEAGALGAASSLVLSFATRRLSLRGLGEALLETAKTTGMVFAIVAGSFIFNAMLAVSRIPNIGAEFIAGLPFPSIWILITIMIFYILLGTFMDGLAILFLTMPTVLPIVLAMGWNPIWFGILFVHVDEVGQITPPFGITLFATKSVLPDVSMADIMRGVMPFLMADSVVLALLIAFPQIILFLPNTIM